MSIIFATAWFPPAMCISNSRTLPRAIEHHERERVGLYRAAADDMEVPQPDFGAIATGFTELSEQFTRCAYLPAVDRGQRILQVLYRLEGKINSLHVRQLSN